MIDRSRVAIPIMVAVVLLAGFSIIGIHGSEGLPSDYPVDLSGGYAVEQPNSTTYVDYLQPGTTENYLIHLFNDGAVQVRYRVTIVDSPDDWLVFLSTGVDETVVDLDPGKGKGVDLNMKVPTERTGEIDIRVRDENTMETWSFKLKIICQRGPLVISLPSDDYILGRNTPSVFDITLDNIGSTVLNVTLDMEGMVPSGSRIDGAWTAVFSDRVVKVQPGRRTVVEATVWPPELDPVGSQKVTSISAKVEGITRPFETDSISFKIQTMYDLRATVTPFGYQRTSVGGSVEFTLSLENWAVDYDTVSLSEYEKPSGWDVFFNDTLDPVSVPITIDPQGERTFHPVVEVPRNAIAGKHEVLLRAEGISNVTFISLKVEVAREDLFEISTMTASGSGDTYRMTVGENLLPVKVVNMGNFYDSVTIEVENRPEWAPLSFHSIKVGSGTNITPVQGAGGLNVSGVTDRTYEFQEDPLTTLSVTFDPGQTAVLYLRADIPIGATGSSGVVGLRYRYGIFQEQQFLQASIKLILADIEIVDIDGDGAADLELEPEPDYEVGDTINFRWVLKNNYPYETVGLRWKVELSGKVLIEGDVPSIPPGETMDFNESWKADKITNVRNVATLKITGDAYASEDRAPSATTDEEVYIEPGPGSPPYALMAGFLAVMIVIIMAFVAFFLWVRKDLEEKEAVERGRYEAIYGAAGREPLPGRVERDRGKARTLSPGERPGLPSSRLDEEQTGPSGRGEKKDAGKKGEPGKKKKGKAGKKAASLGSSGKRRSSSGKRSHGKKRDVEGGAPSKPKKASKLRDLEVYEELEEIDELEEA